MYNKVINECIKQIKYSIDEKRIIMHTIKRWIYKFLKRQPIVEEPWLSYYSKEDRSIRFTTKTIYNYLKECVGNNLDLYALNYFGTRITFGEMFKKINSIAKSLKVLKVEKGDIVTICMPNTPEAVMTFYACNKIGAVADMIHPLSAPNEVKQYLEESNSKILILYDANYEKYREVIAESNIRKTIFVSVSESMPLFTSIGFQILKGLKIKKAPLTDRAYLSWKEFIALGYTYIKSTDVTANAKDLALILHSGGTTGKPKGIMISNYNFNAEAQQGAVNVYNVRPKDKIMTILPIFHGFGLGVCVHCPLCLKVEVILIPEFEAKRFSQIINDYRPNVIAGVPTLWEAMLTNKNFENIDLSHLKYIISGGDHMNLTLENKMNKFLKSRGAKVKMSKGYGMTESVAATAYTFDNSNEPGSVGIPMIGNAFCICKPGSTEILPFNQEGEICVSGPTVMMGYYRNEEETAKVLKRHDDKEIWLHTGDIGYIKENGVIYYTQRIKRIIVSSGFNIYPSVIEEVITSHPKVKQCCVIGIPHPYKMQIAKAFIVLKDGVEPNIKIKAEISLLCKKNLAAYSQPKELEFIDELPKTLYNKIDYKELEKRTKKSA